MASLEKEAKRKAKEGNFRAAGDLFEAAGNTPKAVEMYIQAKEFVLAAKAHEKVGGFQEAAVSYIRAGDFVLAGNCYKLLRDHGKAAHLYNKAGRFELAGEMYEAMREFKQAGECYERAGLWEAAGEMFEKAGDLIRAGEAFEKKGSWLKASRCFEDAKGYRRAAEAAEKAEDLKRAGRCYQLADDPVSSAAKYLEAGDSAEALRVARSVEENSPFYLEAMRQVFRALGERRYLTPLDEKQISRFVGRGIDESTIQAFCEIYALYIRCEMADEAEDLASRIRAEAGTLPGVAEKLAVIKGETRETSIERIEQILKESFDYEQTTRRIQERRAEEPGGVTAPPTEAGDFFQESATPTAAARKNVDAGIALQGLASERGMTDVTTAFRQATRGDGATQATSAGKDSATVVMPGSHPTTVGQGPGEQLTSPLRTTLIEDLKPGFLFDDRYVIVRKLGSGGLGSVFLAEDRKLEETVALKVLKPTVEMADNILFRFKQEIRLTRKIVHPNVVRTYDFGECGDLCYVSMEYIEGRDLKAILRDKGPLPLGPGLKVIGDVCEALDAAHQLGITHRDVKPQNIIVDSKGLVKVIDFGIAKMKDTVGATLTEMFVGTPDYISPEMAIGKPIDHRTDIYAVGIVLYEIFCGKTPFGGGPLVSVLSRHIHDSPRPPREINPSIPPWLERIILKALAKDPDGRHQTVLDLRADIVAAEAASRR